MRPVALEGVEGLRATVFYTLLSHTLVFATLPQAEEYRELVVSSLGGACGDIITLDGRKIRASGIVCGASFSPSSGHHVAYRFTQLPTGRPQDHSDQHAADEDRLNQVVGIEGEPGRTFRAPSHTG